ncbi:ferric reductase-like transmembrane domain-containing protein [Paracoccus siganidrum]|uniref:Oxidoreductase n=1 Tax=Paracoccus siganidrum TaxID=1276757 RepID=A0A419A2N4_9RHOB|nr:ferric reductase-like transmembrane domain-containing protein [Paracoccus siganidrum]RJL07488.1 oxidoreductase [Paracoccus siganidrum]RMC35155.1 oxidoreductase [Paracoccus siganidrum]
MTMRASLWVLAAFAAMALPFVVLLSGERAPGTGWLRDFSKGLGFGALAAAGLQFALTARFRRLAHPFGIDVVYLFHRYLALGAVLLMLGHFGIFYIWYHDDLGQLNPLTARWELTMGRLALLAFALLVVTSEFRKQLRIEYGLWRTAHASLAVVAFAAAILHVLGVGHFTGTTDKRLLMLGVTAGWLLLLAWVRLGKPWYQTHNPWRVTHNIAERGGVHTLVLEPLGQGLRRRRPGQFAWLTLGHSPYGLREHPFTLSDAPEGGPSIAMSIKPLGDFTDKAVTTPVGATAWLDGPYGAFSIDMEPGAPGFVMIAGGIGITPVISNLRAMAARGDMRPVVLFYANPDWEGVTFREELEALQERMRLKIVHVIEEPPDDWEGETGHLTKKILARHLGEATRDWPHMLCGPVPLTDAAKQALRELGVPLWRIDSEIFDMV